MSYKGYTERHAKIQDDINYQADWEWQDLLERISQKIPWRLVDNRESYIKKRMKLEGLE